jgi:hypothetical protein
MTLLLTTDHDSEANHTNNSKSDSSSVGHSTVTSQQFPSQEQTSVTEKQVVPAYKADKANARTEARYTLHNYRGSVNHSNSDSDPDFLPIRCRIENVVEATENMRRNRRKMEEAEARGTPTSREGVKETRANQNQGSVTHIDQAKEVGSKPGITRRLSMLEIFKTAD